MARSFIIVDSRDNVATAIVDLEKNTCVDTESGMIKLTQQIGYGHKFALSQISKGEYVLKYGEKIGRATSNIMAGDHVHVHNVEDIVDEVRRL